jgi:putative endonuclease
MWKLGDRLRQAGEARTLAPHVALGRRGEDVAHRYLEKSGYAVVARNYRAGPDSEIDIVAHKHDTVIFVEVKSRRTDEFGAPDRAIDETKRKSIIRGARAYTTRAGIEWAQVRFDTIAVVFSEPPSITHQEDAFYPARKI